LAFLLDASDLFTVTNGELFNSKP